MENKEQISYVSAFSCLFPSRPKAGEGFSLSSFLGKETDFYYRGSYALWQGIKSLGLGPQEEVLVPAYHCGIEIEAIISAGPKHEFYAIKDDLTLDLDDIKRKIGPNTKALFIIHYFGFPQPLKELREICLKHKLILIEDCAHAFLSRDHATPLGTTGDISIFSLRKSLPVPDGGALVYASGRIMKGTRAARKPGFMNTQRNLMLLRLEALRLKGSALSKIADNIFLPSIKSLFGVAKMAGAVKVSVPDSMELYLDEMDLGMSESSSKILKRINPDEIVARRRENFIFLSRKLSNLKKTRFVFQGLPDGVCPLFFPILIEDRDRVREDLKRRGVQIFVFGKDLHASLGRGDFLVAENFSARNLCLPIHQDLGLSHMSYIVEQLEKVLSQ